MVDNSTVPEFINLIEPEEGFNRYKVHIYTRDETNVGFYELKIVTTLTSVMYQDNLVPQVEYFNVTVVAYPHTERNYAARPRIELIEDQILAIGETTKYELYPDDPDGEDTDVITEFWVISNIA